MGTCQENHAKFQFQIGAIKSEIEYDNDTEDQFCFNSKLVRLKAAPIVKSSVFLSCFNSKLVRLKVTMMY